jgi:hypothetical protein
MQDLSWFNLSWLREFLFDWDSLSSFFKRCDFILMKKSLSQLVQKSSSIFSFLVDLFNFCFFLISVTVRIRFLITGETISFQRSGLRQAFLQLYQEFSFKVACVVMIVVNGVGGIRKTRE